MPLKPSPIFLQRITTSYPGCEGALLGADISEDKVCTDGNIITSRGGKKLDDAKKNLSEFGDIHAIEMDVTNEDSIKSVAEKNG